MSQPEITLKVKKTEVTLKDLLDVHEKSIKLSLNCHHLATVQSVNFADKTLTATINYTKTAFRPDSHGIYQPVQESYPILADVPFIILGGGGAAFTAPIKSGDECLLLFNDRDIDNWTAGATSGPVASSRLHSLSDAIALVGFIDVTDFDQLRAIISFGQTKVGVNTSLGKATVMNATTSLGVELAALMNVLSIMTTAMGAATNVGQVAAAAAAAQAALVPITMNLAGLLE